MALVICSECGKDVSSKAAACPTCGAPVTKKKPPMTRRLLFVGAGIGIAFIYYQLAQKNATDRSDPLTVTSTVSSAEPIAPPQLAQPPHPKYEEATVQVSAFDLARDYDANEVAADNKYKGRRIDITGQVQSINKDFKDEVWLGIAARNQFMPIHASGFSPSQVVELKKGDQITITCRGSGMVIGSPMLKDCVPHSGTQTEVAQPAPSQPAPQPALRSTSFDCRRAKSTPEQLICADDDLSALDRELADILAQAKQESADTQKLLFETRAAWNWREKNCRDKECLLNWYADRKGVYTAALREHQ
jgi:DNA-directed RNA polymerase subunit RPC12/RpoP